MKTLSKRNKEILDARFVQYDPEQLIEGPETYIRVSCPQHGPYEVQVKHLKGKYTYESLRAVKCPTCKGSRMTDAEILEEISQQFFVREDPSWSHHWIPTEGWEPMEHWKRPNLDNWDY